MKKTVTVWMALIALLASAGSLVAHHSLAQYDTTTPVKMKGTIVLFEGINPHSLLFVDQKGEDGKTQRWVLEGPGVLQLARMGIQPETFKVGDVIEACGYIPKQGIPSERTITTTEPISLSLKASRQKTMTGRLITPEYLVMPNGKQQPWSDYGHHKCLGPNYNDGHTGGSDSGPLFN